ncbi:MAG TPA: PfkB family carbohydrate kinase [Streptosporangiaceae bacterium]
MTSAALPRSYLYVPGDQPDRLAKAPARGADALIADLEDAVAPARKAIARAIVRRWLSEGPAGSRGEVWLRINAGQAGPDITEVVSGEIAGVVVPKAEPALLAEVSDLLAARERALGLPPGAIGMLPLIETAAGLLAAAALATAPRVLRLGIGEADLAAELGLRPDPGSDEMTALRLQVVVACAAARIAAPAAPMSADFRDLTALRTSTLALRRLGFRARTAIHPAQVAVINEVFTPSAGEVTRARGLIAAFEEAERTGAGVTTDGTGRMLDVAVVRSARAIVARVPRQSPRVTVLGSLNMDITVTVPRLPEPGMTVLGAAARFTAGGKGANQAVAASRLGAAVRMVGRVGDDDFGRTLLAGLRAEEVNADDVQIAAGVPTGLAMIAVDQAGENHITVAQGANAEVCAADSAAARAAAGDVLVISAEIPLSVIEAALARPRSWLCVLNLAPVPANLAAVAALLGGGAGPDWLVVNEPEAAAVLGRPVDGLGAAERAAADLAAGLRHVVVTAGAQGAALAEPSGTTLAVPGFGVEAVDTVGAGDTFVAALAVALAAGVPSGDAVRAATAAAATAVTRHGAQAALPRPADIAAVTGLTWPVP